ncbi:MAG: 50S ribosomal protein L22 [Candidatus Methanomethyliales bacterium]|nr:50S ribosomal protein L22 [Candidatus Methanomethylicales archaeon]
MPEWGYSTLEYDPDKMARASGRDLRISPKEAREICNAIRHMRLDDAIEYLKRVIDKKEGVPYRKFKSNVPHHSEIANRFGIPSGRYPVKACSEILKVLENAKANAENKGLDIESLRIRHACAQAAMKIRNYIPRAFGRATPFFHPLTHIEIVVEEVGA